MIMRDTDVPSELVGGAEPGPSETAARPGSWWQRRALGSIEAYQRAVEGRPSPCRFFRTCSSYAHEAITVHGTFRGGLLTVRRLLRCRPLGPSGFDPVPEACSKRCRHEPSEKGR